MRRYVFLVVLVLLSGRFAGAQSNPEPKQVEPSQVLVDAPIHEQSGLFVSLSPDGKSVLITGIPFNRPATMRDAQTGAIQRTLVNADMQARRAVFIDDKYYAVIWQIRRFTNGQDDRRSAVTIHDRQKGEIVRSLPTSDRIDHLTELYVSPKGDRLVVYYADAEVFDIETGKLLFTIVQPFPQSQTGGTRRRSIQITDDGSKLLLGDAGRWRVYAMHDGSALTEVRDVGFDGPIAFSSDGLLASVACFPIDGFYDVATGQRKPAPGKRPAADALPILEPTSQNIFYDRSSFSPDGKRWAGQWRNLIFVFDLTAEPPKLMHRLLLDDSHNRRMEWSRDSKRLLAAGNTNNSPLGSEPIWIGDWNVETGKPWHGEAMHANTISAIDVAPDGQEFLTADVRGRIVRWSSSSLKPIGEHVPESPGFPGVVAQRAFYLPDGKKIVRAGMNNPYAWIDRETLKVVDTYDPPSTSTLAISPDAKWVYSDWAPNKPRIQLFNPPQGKSSKTLDLPQGYGRSACFTADSKFLAITTPKNIEIYDLETMKVARTLNNTARSGSGSGTIGITADGAGAYELAGSLINFWNLRSTGDALEPAWHARSRRPVMVTQSAGGQLVIICESEAVTFVDIHTGKIAASLAMADKSPRIARALPGTPWVLVLTSARRLEVYDIRRIFSDAQIGNTDVNELWTRIEKDPNLAYPALVELDQRNAILAELKDLLTQVQERDKQSEAANIQIALLDSEDKSQRETAHRALEAMADKIGDDLRLALLRSTGEKAERISAILRMAGEPSPRNDIVRMQRLCEILSMSSTSEHKQAAETLRRQLSRTTTPPSKP